jgi:LPS-assembly protein
LTLALLITPLPAQTAAPTLGRVRQGEPIVFRALQQEKVGELYWLRGDAEAIFRTYTLRADEIQYNDRTGDIIATGHVFFFGGPHDERISASHGTYNMDSEHGRFYDAVGTTGARLHGRGIVLTAPNPFSFKGEIVDRLGPERLVVHNGVVTSCTLPNPHWSFHATTADVVPGENAKLYNSTFFLWRVPFFYFPFVDHPVEREARKSGILVPSLGTSTVRGQTVGDAVYWAISPSADATVGAELYSKRGWAQHGQFRARFDRDSYLAARYFGVVDHGISTELSLPGPNGSAYILPAHKGAGGEDARVVGVTKLTPNIRAVADIEYINSFLFRATFAETWIQAINTEVRSAAFVSDNWRGYSFNVMGSRYQNFQSFGPGDVITIFHAPGFEASTVDRRLGQTPLYWSFDAALDGVSRREPAPSAMTGKIVSRADLAPSVSLPLRSHGWSLRPELTVRDTYYSERSVTLDGSSAPFGADVNRRAVEADIELRPPALSRLFQKPVLSRQFKHVFEPRLAYHYTGGVDNYADILLFDARDILSNTSDLEYGFVNRLYSKRLGKSCVQELQAERRAALEAAAARRDSGADRIAASAADPFSLSGGSDTNFDELVDSSVPSPAAVAAGVCPAREIITWELKQKYFFDPTFGGAIVSGRRNVFTTTENLTGISFLTAPRRLSPIISRLRGRAIGADLEWQLDYDTMSGRINSSSLLASRSLTKDVTVSGGHFYLQTPGEVISSTLSTLASELANPSIFNQFRATVSYGTPRKHGLTGAGTFGFDSASGLLQYAAVQSTYNLDCCGLTFEYRRIVLGTVRTENQFHFALLLSNVGTFGNLRRQDKVY